MEQKQKELELRARVSGPDWCSQLLSQVELLEGFDELVRRSREPGLGGRPALVPGMAAAAQRILNQYPLDELRAARHYYNSQHLLAFWTHYRGLIRTGVAGGLLSKRFPVASITQDSNRRSLSLQGIRAAQAAEGRFYRLQGTERPVFKRADIDPRDTRLVAALSTQQLLDSLQGRLAWLIGVIKDTGAVLYTHFLAQERHAASAVWTSYKVHLFLDNFLYNTDGGPSGLSRFEFIFFASNYNELIVWLAAQLQRGERLSIAQVAAFLARQTKYNLKLSQYISLAENEVRNRHRELLAYKDSEGIVRLDDVPADVLNGAARYFGDLGVTSQGCPFGRAKGESKNALVEIYEYFDQVFTRTLEASWEFPRLVEAQRTRLHATI